GFRQAVALPRGEASVGDGLRSAQRDVPGVPGARAVHRRCAARRGLRHRRSPARRVRQAPSSRANDRSLAGGATPARATAAAQEEREARMTSLAEFGIPFQRALVRLAMVDEAFAYRAVKHVEPGFFTTEPLGWFWTGMRNHVLAYRMPPSDLVYWEWIRALS